MVAAMLSAGVLEMDCRVCSASGPIAEASRRKWGCDGKATLAPRIECPRCRGLAQGCDYAGCRAGSLVLETCPNKWLDPTFFTVIHMQRHYEAGHLPVAGGVLDQDAWTMEAIAFAGYALSLARKELETRGG